MSKSIIFLVNSFLANFYRHLATFYCSHWFYLTLIHSRYIRADWKGSIKPFGRSFVRSFLPFFMTFYQPRKVALAIFFLGLRLLPFPEWRVRRWWGMKNLRRRWQDLNPWLDRRTRKPFHNYCLRPRGKGPTNCMSCSCFGHFVYLLLGALLV